jgi:hypothetical protein
MVFISEKMMDVKPIKELDGWYPITKNSIKCEKFEWYKGNLNELITEKYDSNKFSKKY